MSCIYGPHHFGNEDQGWVAYFLRCASSGKPVTIYGDGREVRDILYVEDFVEAFLAAACLIDEVRGEVFNIGGGTQNSISLRDLLDWLASHCPSPLTYSFKDWRPGDQAVYTSDIRKVQKRLGWAPRVSAAAGFDRLWAWVQQVTCSSNEQLAGAV